MRIITRFYGWLKYFIQCITFFFYFRIPFSLHLSNKRNACFFCGNMTIGDNVITLSLIKPYIKSHNIKKVYYYGCKKYLNQLVPLYNDYNAVIVWKTINDTFFKKVLIRPNFLNKVITLCNNHKNALHSIFYLQEKIPNNYTVIQYQMEKAAINTNINPYIPTVMSKRKIRQIIINIDSQTIKSTRMIDIANSAVRYCNSNNIKVLFNSKDGVLEGKYELIYPTIEDFLPIVESSLLFLTIRTGLADISVGTSTPFLVIYDDAIINNFSLTMWKVSKKIIVEISAGDYSDLILRRLLGG